jgi:hypothetical protein
LFVGVFGPRSVSLGCNKRQRGDEKNCFHNRPLCVSCNLGNAPNLWTFPPNGAWPPRT